MDKGLDVDMLYYRFRPNIIFKGAGVPFVEDVVTELSISSDKDAVDGTTGIVHLVSKCARCLVRICPVSVDLAVF